MKKTKVLSMLLALALVVGVLPAAMPISALAATPYEDYDRVTYLSEDFETLNEGAINGQSSWTSTQNDVLTADVVTYEGSKMLMFNKSGSNGQDITFKPTINKAVYFNKNDKLSLSFDFMGYERDANSFYYIDLGDGKELTVHMDRGYIDAHANANFTLNGGSPFARKVFYHTEIIFDYAENMVEAYVNGSLYEKRPVKSNMTLDPSEISQVKIWTYSGQCINTPQYIDNIKVEKIVVPDTDRVTYISENFENLTEGVINGQSAWTSTQNDVLVADVVTYEGSKMLMFNKSGANGQHIKYQPTIDKAVYFNEGDKLSLSFDFMGYERDANSFYFIDLGDGKELTVHMDRGYIDAHANANFTLNNGSSFARKVFYHTEIIFDYAENMVEAYVNGNLYERRPVKESITLDPSKISQVDIWTYSGQCINTPQYIDNIKVEKIVAEGEEPGEDPEEPGNVEDLGPSEEGRVLYIAENFERLSTGTVNGQGSWKATLANKSVADIVKKNGSKMLSFWKTGQDDSMKITFAPYINKEVVFEESDKLSISFDLITSAKSGTSGRHFMIDIGDGNRFAIDVEGGRADVEAVNYLYLNGGSGAFSTNQSYHIELVFDYKERVVEGYLNGSKTAEEKLKESAKLDPLKLSKFEIITYSISNHNSPQYIDNIRVEKIVGAPYIITSVTADETVTVNVKTSESEEGSKIIVSSYDANGKLVGIDMGDVEASFESDLTLDGAATVKAVIFGEDVNPLCKNYEGKVIKGQLVNVEDLDYVTNGTTLTVYKPMSSYTSFEETPWAEETGIKNVVIEENGLLASVPANAFTGFSELETIEIPETVTTVSEDAFPNTDFTVYGCKNTAASEYAASADKEFLISKLRVLGIGNSHTADYSQWRDLIFKDIEELGAAKIEYVKIGFGGAGMYTSSATFDGYTHAHYVYGTNPGSSRNYVYADALDKDVFDIILIQDYCESTYGREDFLEGISKTMAWLKGKQPQAKVGWVADWVDRNQADDPADVDAVQQLYYDNTVRLAEKVMAEADVKPDFIVPMGTAVQNIRTSYLGSVKNAADCYTNYSNSDWIGSAEKIVNYTILERDGTHCSYELGRYAMGATVYAWLFDYFKDELKGGDIDFLGALKTAPVTEGVEEWKGEFTDSIWAIVKETAENVLANNWTITNSAYTTDPIAAKAQEVVDAEYSDFTAEGIVKTINSLGEGFTVDESDVTISGDSATVRFLYGYTEKTVTISK